jgi:hypothetical protein
MGPLFRVRAALGLAAACARSVRDGLPFDAALRAFNVAEVPIDRAVIRQARELYERHVANHVRSDERVVSNQGCTFYAEQPGWPSDIRWWSADDEATFARFQRLFDQVLPSLAARGLWAQGGRLYCGFFVTRSRCNETAFHFDYVDECGANAYTFMTPIDDWEGPAGQLVYRDAFGRRCTYQYKKGVAIVLGARFHHGTQPCVDVPRAFLCFTFGTSNPEAWPHIRRTVAVQSRLFRGPDGAFQNRSQPAGPVA